MHAQSIRRFGGGEGVRDPGLVDSALASAMNTSLYGGGNLFDVAAAYAFHLAESQPFLDGNKRVGCSSALAFLRLNGHPVLEDDGSLYDGMIAIANKQMNKAGLAEVFRRLTLSK